MKAILRDFVFMVVAMSLVYLVEAYQQWLGLGRDGFVATLLSLSKVFIIAVWAVAAIKQLRDLFK